MGLALMWWLYLVVPVGLLPGAITMRLIVGGVDSVLWRIASMVRRA